MESEYIWIDVYGREMRLYHYCNEVYCDHIKNGKVIKKTHIHVDNDIVKMFRNQNNSGAYIYDEIKRRYGKSL